MTRRELLALSMAIAACAQENHEVALLMSVSDGTLVSGDSTLAQSWTLPPGSTCKPFTMQALLQANRLRPAETFLCPGELRVGNHNLTCSHPRGLAPLDAARVIAYSCNCATAHFAQRFRPDELASALRQYGFRVNSGSDVRLMALGEEGVLVTPLILANAYRRLAGNAEPPVREGLEGAVQYGTAQGAAVAGLSVAGKTGTVITSGGLHAALFAGFEPSRAPQYVAVVIMQGRSGGADAAPFAAELFRRRKPMPSGSGYRVRFGQTVASLPVEEYVAAVLAGEASTFEHAEALKAMAVAARTYAANQKGRHAGEGFDFCNTTHCQRAETGGIPERLTRAAQATAGEMLRVHNSVAFTPYSMCCGGMTEDGAAVWPAINAHYLRVKADPYCQPDVWNSELSFRDVTRALQASGLSCPEQLREVAVSERSESGRARRLLLNGNHGQSIGAGAFRFAIGRELGWNIVRSNWFSLSSGSGNSLQIRGRGMGHGVGLCQRGAESMASQGYGYRDILAFYYPDTTTISWVRMGGDRVVVYGTDPVRERRVLSEAELLMNKLPWSVNGTLEIYVYPTVNEFRNAMHEPGWVAGRTEGRRIDLQPMQILDRKGSLTGTLQHEMLHVAIESRAIAGLPVWFREGVVEYLCRDNRPNTAIPVEPADESLRQRSNQQQASMAYRQAHAKVADLAARYGETAVLSWVTQGLPDEVRNSTANTLPTKSR